MNKTGILTDCVCDLPEDYIVANNIDVIYFYIHTDTGRFRDVYEITSENLIDYIERSGGKALTTPPSPEEYMNFFEQNLKKYDEIIHIAISSRVSKAYENAIESLKMMGSNAEKVHIIDSSHLSTGIGHLVLTAVEMRDKGKACGEIIAELETMKNHISTSFITVNADYLYLNGRVSAAVKNVCNIFNLHPILTMINGELKLKRIEIGSYEKAAVRYVKSELRHANKINAQRAFVTHVGCTVKFLRKIKLAVSKFCPFEEIIPTKASATISGNCGTGTFGILFVYKY